MAESPNENRKQLELFLKRQEQYRKSERIVRSLAEEACQRVQILADARDRVGLLGDHEAASNREAMAGLIRDLLRAHGIHWTCKSKEVVLTLVEREILDRTGQLVQQ